MQAGAYLTTVDLATVSLYLFWVFFAGLVLYLNRESKREGYPLVTPGKPNMRVEGFPGAPSPKMFKLQNGEIVMAPRPTDVQRPIAALFADRTPGAPMIPTGDPLVDGVGPAAYASRADRPALTYDDATPAIVPLRIAGEFSVDSDDPDPRGFTVVDADGVAAGICVDVWIDKTEMIFRYVEVAVPTDLGTRSIMIPVPLIRVDGAARKVKVRTLMARNFANAPVRRSPNVITLLEEDMAAAYCAGGQLYAKAERMGPLL